jgi:filamentous hemagglutinin family protein
MSARKPRSLSKAALVGLMLFGASGVFSIGHAQVTADTSAQGNLGTAVTAGPNYDITGGTRPGGGTNLFHGFNSFSLTSADTANFINDSGLPTSNILSRVTGGNPSNIFGTIQTTGFPGANLFLMNPAGIIFGPTAQLNVEGSFHATTADYLKLGDGGIFYADPTKGDVLTSAPVSAFGFLAANPAPIDINTSGVILGLVDYPLMGALGQTLSFVGGTVNVGAADGSAPGYVLSPGGRVNLVSVAGPGEAAFDGTGFNVDGVAKLGAVNIRGGSIVDGKDVFIRGGELTIDDGIIFPNVFYFFGLAPQADGGEVNIKVSGGVTMKGTTTDPLTDSPPGIFVFSGDFFNTDVAGKVPDVNITANSVSISGFAGIQADRLGPGASGDVVINADTVNVSNGGSVALFNAWEGAGGNLTINARDVSLSGDGSPSAVGFEGLGSQGLFHPLYLYSSVDPALTFGDSGNINLNLSGNLNVQGQAQITTDSLNFGRGGNININAANIVLVGAGAETGLIGAQSQLAGDAGNININATGTINVQNGFRISSSTVGVGNGGDVTVTAGKSITFDGADSRILSVTIPLPDDTQNAVFQSIFGEDFDTLRADLADCCGYPADADLFTVLGALNDLGFTAIPGELKAGDGGKVVVNTSLLTMNAGTRIETSTGWDGNAGSIQVNVGSLMLNGAALNSTSGFQRLTGDAVIGTGTAGAIGVNATDTISISGAGSKISSSTFGDGKGGDVTLSAGNQVNIVNGGHVSADSGGTIGGAVHSGTGLAGDINISSGNQITLDNGQITTQALTADGGNIKLTAPNTVQLQDSVISTSVQGGLGQGGNINIDPQFVLLNGSSIIANAYGGPGGNITIVADNFLQSTDSAISASSALSTPGTIQIQSPDNNVESSIAQLPSSFLDAASLLRGLCSARRTGAPSSFVVAGRGGVPVDADSYLPSFGTDTAAAMASTDGAATADAGRHATQRLALALLIPKDLDCAR